MLLQPTDNQAQGFAAGCAVEEGQERNQRIAKTRAWVEHVFGGMGQMGAQVLKTIGLGRARFQLTLRCAVNMIAAVSPRGDFRFMVHAGTVKARVFRTFLRRLMVGATAPVFVVVDGHPAHKAKLVTKFVESTNGMLKRFFLPPYAPPLNPDEQVWAHVKREVSRRGVQNLEQMQRLARSALRWIQKLPGLVRSFFHQPECQYASPDIIGATRSSPGSVDWSQTEIWLERRIIEVPKRARLARS